jgi:chromatin segregation and condensation protein Rec8/ScpA/Scc1 (kleisin family)
VNVDVRTEEAESLVEMNERMISPLHADEETCMAAGAMAYLHDTEREMHTASLASMGNVNTWRR